MKKPFNLFLLLLLLIYPNINAAIIMQPYLQAVTQNSIYVLVECNVTDTVFVNYGLTSSFGSIAKTESVIQTTQIPATYVHRIKLINLQSNTTYFYKAAQGPSVSLTSNFITAVPAGTPFRFVWMADCRTGTKVHDRISQKINLTNAAFSLYGGDLCYDNTYDYWKNEFFRPDELTVISHIPFFNSPGNHEGSNQNTQAFTYAPVSASGTQEYYSFNYGDMHVLVMNTELPYKIGSPQYNFAVTDLSSASTVWKIVISHKPAYCAGGHGEDDSMKDLSQNVFVPNHVNVVISGHSHFYQHNYVDSIHHVIIGSAGADLVRPRNASYTLNSVMDYNYSVIDVNNVQFKMIIYNNNNIKLDSIILTKNQVGINHNNNFISNFSLEQNYPNPFNPETIIKFTIPEESDVTLQILDVQGKEMKSFINARLIEGSYSYILDVSELASGIYFYKLTAGNASITKKMSIIK